MMHQRMDKPCHDCVDGHCTMNCGPLRSAKVFLRCSACGNAKIAERVSTDPPGTYIVVTNECDICNAASGGFEDVHYYDRQGNEVAPI